MNFADELQSELRSVSVFSVVCNRLSYVKDDRDKNKVITVNTCSSSAIYVKENQNELTTAKKIL